MHYRHSLNSLNDIIDRVRVKRIPVSIFQSLITARSQDDKASLAELHDYIIGSGDYPVGDEYDYKFAALPSPDAGPQLSPILDDFAVTTPTSTSKADRRRSLPSRMSITSLASYTSDISAIIAPTPTEGSFKIEPEFHQRRRRAAKLTHFFGVDYRDLMSEILDSLEKGLEEERGKGTLKPDEVQVRFSVAVYVGSSRSSSSILVHRTCSRSWSG